MAEKKPITEAQKAAMMRYQRKFVHTAINIEREKRDRIQEYCKRHNTSLTTLLNEFLDGLLEKEALEKNSAK